MLLYSCRQTVGDLVSLQSRSTPLVNSYATIPAIQNFMTANVVACNVVAEFGKGFMPPSRDRPLPARTATGTLHGRPHR
jgi:hypothetical protein